MRLWPFGRKKKDPVPASPEAARVRIANPTVEEQLATLAECGITLAPGFTPELVRYILRHNIGDDVDYEGRPRPRSSARRAAYWHLFVGKIGGHRLIRQVATLDLSRLEPVDRRKRVHDETSLETEFAAYLRTLAAASGAPAPSLAVARVHERDGVRYADLVLNGSAHEGILVDPRHGPHRALVELLANACAPDGVEAQVWRLDRMAEVRFVRRDMAPTLHGIMQAAVLPAAEAIRADREDEGPFPLPPELLTGGLDAPVDAAAHLIEPGDVPSLDEQASALAEFGIAVVDEERHGDEWERLDREQTKAPVAPRYGPYVGLLSRQRDVTGDDARGVMQSVWPDSRGRAVHRVADERIPQHVAALAAAVGRDDVRVKDMRADSDELIVRITSGGGERDLRGAGRRNAAGNQEWDLSAPLHELARDICPEDREWVELPTRTRTWVCVPHAHRAAFDALLADPIRRLEQYGMWHQVEKHRRKRTAAVAAESASAEMSLDDALDLLERAGLRPLEQKYFDEARELAEAPYLADLLRSVDWSHSFPGDHKNELGAGDGWIEIVGMMTAAAERDDAVGDAAATYDADLDAVELTFTVDGRTERVVAQEASSKHLDRFALTEIAEAICPEGRDLVVHDDTYRWIRSDAVEEFERFA